uniref:TSA: Wollemia nobilis Ref_Wollemi_Transcript_6853_1155 transcribed RNA sequence n=1 Tax=Wollemia nobilis TaxID=56998 RepID=A0A0C9S9R6_9CONI
MVDFQAMDSTSSEIRRLRDEELYPKLVDLVSGMAHMWRKMYDNHCKQQEIVDDLRGLEVSNAPEETTKQHHDRTLQLYSVVNDWSQQSSKLLQYQKDYINHLNNWLRLNLVPIESNLKERLSSPPQTANPPIHGLLQVWHNQLDKVPEQGVVQGLKSFAAIIQRIAETQEEEMKQKLIYEEAKAEFERKEKAFEEWHRKYKDKNMPIDQASEQPEENNKDPMIDRQNQIQMLKSKAEDEKSKYVKACKYTRAVSLNYLKTGLPAVFLTMSEFARVCMNVYMTVDELKSNLGPLENGE